MAYRDPADAKRKARQYYLANRDRIRERQRRYNAAHRAEQVAYSARYRRENRDFIRSLARRYVYGLDQDRFAELWQIQGGKCPGCCRDLIEGGHGRGLHVDHDHACCPGERSCGRCVRGLLCPECNRALAAAQDDPANLRRLASYLEAHPLQPTGQLPLFAHESVP